MCYLSIVLEYLSRSSRNDVLLYSTRDGKLHYCAVPDDPDRSVSQSVVVVFVAYWKEEKERKKK